MVTKSFKASFQQHSSSSSAFHNASGGASSSQTGTGASLEQSGQANLGSSADARESSVMRQETVKSSESNTKSENVGEDAKEYGKEFDELEEGHVADPSALAEASPLKAAVCMLAVVAALAAVITLAALIANRKDENEELLKQTSSNEPMYDGDTTPQTEPNIAVHNNNSIPLPLEPGGDDPAKENQENDIDSESHDKNHVAHAPTSHHHGDQLSKGDSDGRKDTSRPGAHVHGIADVHLDKGKPKAGHSEHDATSSLTGGHGPRPNERRNSTHFKLAIHFLRNKLKKLANHSNYIQKYRQNKSPGHDHALTNHTKDETDEHLPSIENSEDGQNGHTAIEGEANRNNIDSPVDSSDEIIHKIVHSAPLAEVPQRSRTSTNVVTSDETPKTSSQGFSTAHSVAVQNGNANNYVGQPNKQLPQPILLSHTTRTNKTIISGESETPRATGQMIHSTALNIADQSGPQINNLEEQNNKVSKPISPERTIGVNNEVISTDISKNETPRVSTHSNVQKVGDQVGSESNEEISQPISPSRISSVNKTIINTDTSNNQQPRTSGQTIHSTVQNIGSQRPSDSDTPYEHGRQTSYTTRIINTGTRDNEAPRAGSQTSYSNVQNVGGQDGSESNEEISQPISHSRTSSVNKTIFNADTSNNQPSRTSGQTIHSTVQNIGSHSPSDSHSPDEHGRQTSHTTKIINTGARENEAPRAGGQTTYSNVQKVGDQGDSESKEETSQPISPSRTSIINQTIITADTSNNQPPRTSGQTIHSTVQNIGSQRPSDSDSPDEHGRQTSHTTRITNTGTRDNEKPSGQESGQATNSNGPYSDSFGEQGQETSHSSHTTRITKFNRTTTNVGSINNERENGQTAPSSAAATLNNEIVETNHQTAPLISSGGTRNNHIGSSSVHTAITQTSSDNQDSAYNSEESERVVMTSQNLEAVNRNVAKKSEATHIYDIVEHFANQNNFNLQKAGEPEEQIVQSHHVQQQSGMRPGSGFEQSQRENINLDRIQQTLQMLFKEEPHDQKRPEQGREEYSQENIDLEEENTVMTEQEYEQRPPENVDWYTVKQIVRILYKQRQHGGDEDYSIVEEEDSEFRPGQRVTYSTRRNYQDMGGSQGQAGYYEQSQMGNRDGRVVGAGQTISRVAGRCPDQVQHCETHSCKKSASRAFSLIDVSFNPCDDFYSYACGGLEDDSYREIDDRDAIYEQVKGFDTTDVPYIQKFKEFYDSCMNFDESINYKFIGDLIKSLLHKSSNNEDMDNRERLTELLGDILLLGPSASTSRLTPIFDIEIDVNETEHYVPVLTMPVAESLATKIYSYDFYEENCFKVLKSNKVNETNLQLWYKTYTDCLENPDMYLKNLEKSLIELHIIDEFPEKNQVLAEIKGFHEQVFKPLGNINKRKRLEVTEALNTDVVYWPVEELQKNYPLINWKSLFVKLFQSDMSDYKIKINFKEYLDKLFQFYEQKGFDQIKFNVIAMLAHDLYMDINLADRECKREDFCIKAASHLMDDIAARILLANHSPEELQEFDEYMMNMFKMLKTTFKKSISHEKMQERLDKLSLFPGRQNFYFMSETLEYRNDKLKLTNLFSENLIALKKNQRYLTYARIFDATPAQWVYRYNLWDTNLAVLLTGNTKNTIVIPAGFLFKYGKRVLSKAQKYEMFSTVGYELSRGIMQFFYVNYLSSSSFNIDFSNSENLQTLMANSNYTAIPNRFGFKISEEDIGFTLNSRFMDNAALYLSFESYVGGNHTELGLPLLQVSIPQLFYLLTVQNNCQKNKDKVRTAVDLIENYKLPAYFRFNSIAMNSLEFSRSYNCSIASWMNPRSKIQANLFF